MAWISLATALIAVHVLANVVWIGSLLAVALLISQADSALDPADVARLAGRVHARLAVPAFLASFGAGAVNIALSPLLYAHAPWFHAKLTFAFGVIDLHHVIGARAKRVAAGRVTSAQGVGVLGIVTLICAAGAVLLGVAKALPGR